MLACADDPKATTQLKTSWPAGWRSSNFEIINRQPFSIAGLM